MTRLFPPSAAGTQPLTVSLDRILTLRLFRALRGGILADDEPYISGASPTVLDPVVYESRVNTGGTGAVEIVTLAAGASPGQRHYIRMGTRANAADVLRIQAGADTTLKRNGTAVAPVVVSKKIGAAAYDAGTSVFQSASVSGRITRIRSVGDILTAGVGTVTLKLATVVVEGLTLVTDAVVSVGELDDSGAMDNPLDSLTNIVKAGDPIEIVSDGTPTAGAIEVYIEITPDAEQAPVVVDALMPNTQYESASIDVFAVAPVAGEISRFRSIVDIVTAAIGTLTLELGGTTVVGSAVTVAAVAAAGVADDSGAITAGATTTVVAGDQIGLVSDGVPTDGAVDCTIEIQPTAGRGPVIVEKIFTATELAAGTSVWAPSPIAGHVSRVRAISDVAITVGDVEIAIELGGIVAVDSEVTVEFSGSAIGDVDESVAMAAAATTLVAAGGAIEITSDNGNTAGELHVFIEIDPETDIAQIDLSEPGDYALMEFDGAAWNYVKGSGAVA